MISHIKIMLKDNSNSRLQGENKYIIKEPDAEPITRRFEMRLSAFVFVLVHN